MSKNFNHEIKNVDQSLVSDHTPSETFTDIVQTKVRTNRVMDELVMATESLEGEAGTITRVRKRGTLSMEDATAGEEMTQDDFTHGKVDVDTAEHKDGLVVEIETEADEDSITEEFRAATDELGEAGAEKMDIRAYDELLSASGSSSYVEDLSSAGTLTYSDVTELHAKMRDGNGGDKSRPDAIIISFGHVSDLKTEDDRFTAVNKSGSDEALREGLVGRFDGLRVYTTSQANAPDSSTNDKVQAVILDSQRAYAKGVKRSPTIKTDEDISKDVSEIAYTARYGYQVVDADAIGLLKNPSA